MNTKMIYSLFGFLLFSPSVLATKTGEPAPICITKQAKKDHTLDIADYKGKVVYIDFWASWCPPCKLSFPSLNLLHNELKSQGFEIVAINLDENKADALEFLQHTKVNFSIVYDENGICPKAYQVKAMPSSYIIDKQGIVREIHLGFDEEKLTKIRSTIIALLSE